MQTNPQFYQLDLMDNLRFMDGSDDSIDKHLIAIHDNCVWRKKMKKFTINDMS